MNNQIKRPYVPKHLAFFQPIKLMIKKKKHWIDFDRNKDRDTFVVVNGGYVMLSPGSSIQTELQMVKWIKRRWGMGEYLLLTWKFSRKKKILMMDESKYKRGLTNFWQGVIYNDCFVRIGGSPMGYIKLDSRQNERCMLS